MISNLQWLNSNETRNYPLFEEVTRKANLQVLGADIIIPNTYLLDLTLSNTLTFIQSGLVKNNIDYFILSIKRNGSADTQVFIREIQREVYSSLDPSTYRDIGFFRVPFGTEYGTVIELTPNVDIEVEGKLIIGIPTDFQFPIGTRQFIPAASTIEPSVCVPSHFDRGVTSLGEDGEPEIFTGNVKLWEGTDTDLTSIPENNAIRIDFKQDVINCETEIACKEDSEDVCAQPALMKINGVEGNSAFSLILTGEKAINVAALRVPPPGGDPFDPSSFVTRGLVITYHGPMYSRELPDGSYEYGLDCTMVAESLLNEANSRLDDVENGLTTLQSMLP